MSLIHLNPPQLAGKGRRQLAHLRCVFLYLAVVFSLASTSSLIAQGATGSIEGRIEPAHDHEVTLATATIPSLGLEVAIEGDGSFRFERVRAGNHVLIVRLPTVGSAAQRVTVEEGQSSSVTVRLEPGAHFEEVSVTGETRGAEELATPVTTLSGDQLLLRGEATLGETLSNEAGISSSFFGLGASRPIIRGLAGDRVRMLEDGLGTGDASDVSVDHAVTIDPLQAERIEVLRGPATLLYGSSAVGGAVNVIDERIPSTRATRTVGGTVDLRAGSAAQERALAAALHGGSGEWAWSLSANSRETDDYEVPGFAELEEEEEEHEGEEEEEAPFGEVPNSDLETTGARVGVTRFFGDSGFLGVSVSGFDTEYGVPGGHGHGEHGDEHDDDEHDDEHGDEHDDDEHDDDEHGDEHDDDEHGEEEEIIRIDMKQRRLDLRGAVTRDFGIFDAVRFRLGANDYEHVELEGEEQGTLFFNDYLEGRVELSQRRTDRRAGSIGLQFSDRDLEAVGAEAFIPKSASQRFAVFTFQELTAGALTWQLGARFETQDNEAIGEPSITHDGFSASAGLVWRLNDEWSIASSLSRSAKLPALEELFADGPHLATRSFEIGDRNLTEEIGVGFDVSFRRTEGRVTGELTLFRQDFDDFIFQAFTGEEEDELPVVLFSQQDAEFQGAELTARIELLDQGPHHLHFRVVGDMVDAELDAGDNLPRIPPMSLSGGLHYHSERWNAMAEVRWVDDQDDVGVNESPTDGYTMVNASVGYRLIFGGRIVDLVVRGKNLTDEEARVHSSFLKNFAPLPGRDVSLSARFWF